jgi:hypothetical protein
MDKLNLIKCSFEPGVDYRCFAHFKCTRCKQGWGSVWAWKKYGQQCALCIAALQKLVDEGKRSKEDADQEIEALPKEPGFNFSEIHYYCCPQCKNYWAWEKIEEGMRCNGGVKKGEKKKCGTLVKPESEKEYRKYEKAEMIGGDNSPEFPANNKIGGHGEEGEGYHSTSLCEYCKLGGCKIGVSLFVQELFILLGIYLYIYLLRRWKKWRHSEYSDGRKGRCYG